ncbi:MAG: hypothetical protein FWE60_02015 [Oscillospiraceae bacterium]|nr:hypothetical protein [Oscillospiraceae bacterium]
MIAHFRRFRSNGKKPLLRWVCYSLMLLFFFTVMSGGFFRSWQPIFIIPLAIAVAMHEREFGGALFGAVCGLMIDTACGNLFGMSSVWLMPCTLAASLLIMNLMRSNFINHLWMTASACLIMAFMEYFFKYLIWDEPNSGIILRMYIIPSYIWAIMLSPPVYFLVRVTARRFKAQETGQLTGSIDEPESDG